MDRRRVVYPTHTIVDETIPGIARIALREFGGDRLSPALADIRIRGRTLIQVVGPESAASDEADTQRFREAVRLFAETSDLLNGRSGMTIAYAFDPSGAVPEPIRRG